MSKMLLNHGWKFSLDGGAQNPVDLPHDWLVGDAYNHYKSGVGKYTRTLNIEPTTDKTGEKLGGRVVSLRFDGVYMDSALHVNGQIAGEWKYGYTTFEFDITDYLREGDNELELTVNYDGQSSRWYSGAGIYRNVWLITKNACHFKSDGIYVTTALVDGKWTWEAEAEVETGGRPFDVRHKLLETDKWGQVRRSASGLSPDNTIDTSSIKPWDISNPQLYTVRSELIVDGKIADTVDTIIGFRTIEFTTDKGFFLNGRYIKIKGVCQHHDLGSLGAAFHKAAARRQLDVLRRMGVNAIRTAHNPPAPELMELCDEMGFLVMSELTDIWRNPKTPGDYARFFDDWVERDVASWIRRDRNNPCIIMWSVGNEIPDTHADAEKGGKTLALLQNLVKKHDPKGNAPATFSSNYMAWENTQKCVEQIKLIGYNYGDNLYYDHHEKHPDWIIFGGETCSTLQSRSVYHFPLSKAVLADDDLQCSSLGNTTTSWGAKNVETCIKSDFDAEFSLGQFLWSGTDYLGEPTPYHTKNCYFGHTDTACFEKDTYYIFKAAWTDFKDDPFVYVFPYWDFSPSQIIDVRVCSNAPRVALFLNGEKIGDADLTCDETKWVASWQVPYKEGTLRAEAYDETGKNIATTERSSFGDAVTLKTETVTYDEKNPHCNALDFITITAFDANDRPVENANCRVNVSVENGELLTLDNGDATDYESYHATSKRLFSGKLLAIVRRTGNGDPVVSVSLDKKDIPIRKIELIKAPQGDAKDAPCEVKAKIFPEDATYSDLQWRLTDAGGIDSPMGDLQISDDKKTATITPKGDGSGYIRCSADNGREHPMLICVLEFEVTGMGKPFLNPYEFLSAGLYNACNAEPGSGNERGVATLKMDETHVGFMNIDFGSFGSDEITLWLFPLSHDPFDFEIWEGMPSDGGKHIYTAHYDKGHFWNTYIEAAYKLPRRFRGITTLCLVFYDKVHIKGFQFSRPDKAYAKLYAAECDTIYGDNFEKKDKCVEDIGNNVSIIFDDMDFGGTDGENADGAGKLTLSHRSTLPTNPMRLDFESDSGTVTQMLTLPRSETYTEQTYLLETPLTGRGKLSLVFLPGCSLDLEYLQFCPQ